MTAKTSSASYGLRSFATLLICRYRVSPESITGVNIPSHHHISSGMRLSKFGYGIGSSTYQSLSISSGNSVKMSEPKKCISTPFSTQFFCFRINPELVLPVLSGKTREQEDTSDSDPPRPSIFSWVKWVFASILPLLFSSWKQKWDNMLKLEGKVEEVVKEAEEVAEVVEKVAFTTEKLSAEVAENLNNGELKEVAMMVEHVSSVTAKDARMVEAFINKVGDLKQDLTELENMVEPVIDKIENKK